MDQREARQLIEDLDVLLQKDAPTAHSRERLRRLREELLHVEETGEWPTGERNPWGHFAEDERA